MLSLLGGKLLWREQFGAEPCMKPLYCLELPVLPERRGQLLFTRSHAYTACVLVYDFKFAYVSSSVCVWCFCGLALCLLFCFFLFFSNESV